MTLKSTVQKLSRFQKTNDIEAALEFVHSRPNGCPTLHAIVRSGWIELMERVDVLAVMDTAEMNNQGEALLHEAATASPGMLQATLLQGLDNGLFAFDDEGYTPAMTAVHAGRLDNLKILARAGADFDQVCPETGRCALEVACCQKDINLVRYLLDAGADATLVDLEALSDDETAQEDAVSEVEAARALRQAMDLRRFKTIDVHMGSGEASFTMPAAIAQGSDLFIADVIGDLAGDTRDVRAEYGQKAFGDGPNAINAAIYMGMPDIAQKLQKRRDIQQAEQATAPKGQKPN